MNKFEQLRAMLREMEDCMWGDVIGGICLMLTLYAVLLLAVVL